VIGFDIKVLEELYSLDFNEINQRSREVLQGKIKLLYVAPERLLSDNFASLLTQIQQRMGIATFAIDEAHCVSLWGHDFRPEYSRIAFIREILGNPLTLALTATATVRTQRDILEKCGIQDAEVFRGGFARPNLALSTLEVNGLSEKIRTMVLMNHSVNGPKIIYCSLISTVIKVREELERLGLRPMVYHGELQPNQRRRVLREFIDSPDAILIATPAFGLGINKPNIRMVMHAEIPGSIEAYFQEVGRAGRDGLPAQGLVLFDEDDVSIQREFIEWGNPDESFISGVYQTIKSQAHRIQTEGIYALKEHMSYKSSRDFRVESSLQILARMGAVRESEESRLGYEQVSEPTAAEFLELKSEERRKMLLTKLLEMVRWIAEPKCRMQSILSYMGQESLACGVCDRCKEAPE
jgi:ATP-dependent DNA helicase RecQ